MNILSCFTLLVITYRAAAHDEDGQWSQIIVPAGGDPGARVGAAATVIGNSLYVVGGDQKSGGFQYYSTDKYVPEANAWIHLGPQGRLPQNFVYSDMDAVGGMLFLFGGQNNPTNDSGYFNDIMVLHPSDPENYWQTIRHNGTVPYRSAHTATHVSGKILVFGGWNWTSTQTQYFNDLWEFDTTSLYLTGIDVQPPYWNQLKPSAPLPPGRDAHSAVAGGGGLWIFGGFSHNPAKGPWVGCSPDDQCMYYNDLWKYDARANTWTKMNPSGDIPAGRWGHSADVIGNRMLIFGGNMAGSVNSNDIYSYDFTNNHWQLLKVTNAPTPRYSHVSGHIGSNLYIYGGSGGVNDLWRFTLNVEQTYITEGPELMGITGAAIFLVILVAILGFITVATWRRLKAQTSFETHGDIQTGSLDD